MMKKLFLLIFMFLISLNSFKTETRANTEVAHKVNYVFGKGVQTIGLGVACVLVSYATGSYTPLFVAGAGGVMFYHVIKSTQESPHTYSISS